LKGKLINDSAGESFELFETSSIGRTRESAIPIADPRTSRRHALIRRQNDGFWFFDLGSSNGSMINGRRVTTAQRLKEGDLIQIGNHQLRFQGGLREGETFDTTLSDHTLVEIQSRDVILLVSDIQGFTDLSEKLAPEQLAPIIGTWYAETERALETHGANLDKFIGDCVLAYWLDTSPASRLAAVKTAVAMRQVCQRVNETHQATLATLGLSFQTGAALHRGSAAYGAMSASEFTLLGDAVNLAFRLESLTRDLGKEILVSAEFLHTWEEGHALCESCGSKQVKGRAEPVEVFSLERSPA
jgi:adenylate cyclase